MLSFKMADGRARVNREFRDKLTERVHSNLVEAGKLGQQLTRSSKSHEILTQTTKHFVGQEGSLANTMEKVEHIRHLNEQMKSQCDDVHRSLQAVGFVKKQLDFIWTDVPRG